MAVEDVKPVRHYGRVRLLILAVIPLTILAACGDDTSGAGRGAPSPASTSPGDRAISFEQWSRRVERLCGQNATRAERKVLELRDQARAKNLSETEFVARVLDASRDLTAPALDEVDALPPPRGHEQQARQFTASIRKTFPIGKAAAQAIRDNDEKASQRANDALLEAAVPARALARELNVEECIPRGSASAP